MINILTASPYNFQQNVTVDSKIVLEFDAAIDPFTVERGLSLYTPSPSLWTGPDLAILDTEYRDVLDVTEEYTYFPFNWSLGTTSNGVVNGKLTITPVKSLLPDRDYYLAVYPGSDASRYISKETSALPVYSLETADPATFPVSVTSAYTGDQSGTINLAVTSVNGTEVQFTVTDTAGDISIFDLDFTDGQQEIAMDNLTLTVDAVTWALLDTVDIDVFVAEGVAAILKNKFTTTHLDTSTSTKSTRIERLSDVSNTTGQSIRLISSIPQDLSINNVRYNPITLKFNQDIDDTQDISSKINITRKDIDSGTVRTVNFYYKINGSTIKLYLTSLA